MSRRHPTFEEASQKIEKSLYKHLERIEKSAKMDTGDADGYDSDEETVSEDILKVVFESYGGDQIERSLSMMQDSIPGSCLICLSSVKKDEPIWNCVKTCYTSFHLHCIQRWAKDSIYQIKTAAESMGNIPPETINWCCPKCRTEYSPKEIPSKYFCFCEKVQDPKSDPWLVPHSCGEICAKNLKPDCGHQCTLLCHPGPCPPCPKTVSVECFCGKSAPATKRCFARFWSCNKSCNKLLSCGLHPCPLPCHGGDCKACEKTSVQLCLCKRNQKKCDCAHPKWQCEEKCLKPLSCGHHRCDSICHEGECDPCRLSQLRSCPCGKSKYQLDCTLATPTCGDTCGKQLQCGRHLCAERCHRGDCGTCFQTILKRCRCGAKAKEVACTKDYFCDIKCKKLRDCGKHNCNKKCCDGTSCLPCEQVCNKTLSCKNHKCPSRCHTGVCYPCSEMKQITCFCGKNKITVPCGMEKTAKKPKCKNKCEKPSECHHGCVQSHLCHYGACPPCRLPCGQIMECSHECKALCHDLVRVKVTNDKAIGPWEATNIIETKTLQCPDCPELLKVKCLGGHDEALLPCHAARVTSCGRKCGRILKCKNHVCERKCHRVKNAESEDTAGSNCQKCENQCEKPRPDGCHHKCPKTCHPGSCGKCQQMIWIQCHCGINKLYLTCHIWNEATDQKKNELGCCKDQCPKLLNCGHRCPLTCHNGPCPTYTTSCCKKVKLSCSCKRIKREYICSSLDLSQRIPLKCDENCPSQQKPIEVTEAPKEETLHQNDQPRTYEKRNRNRRNRRQEVKDEEESFLTKYKSLFISFAVILTSLLAYYAFAK